MTLFLYTLYYLYYYIMPYIIFQCARNCEITLIHVLIIYRPIRLIVIYRLFQIILETGYIYETVYLIKESIYIFEFPCNRGYLAPTLYLLIII